MTPLPPNVFESGANALALDDAAVSLRQTDDTAAEYDSLMDCIGEIFAGARKLFDPDPAAYTNADEAYYDLLRQLDDPHAADLIEVPAALWAEFDPPPLFLRAAGF